MAKRLPILALCLAICWLSASPTWAATDARISIEILDAEGLRAISQDPSADYVLVADIDMGGVLWTPIEFTGTMDGGGHTIYNLTVRETHATPHTTVDGNHDPYPTFLAGLFSYAKDAAIQNLHLLNVDIRISADQYVFAGGLVGLAEDTRIDRCSVSGRIYVTSSKKMFGAGGLVGFAEGTGSIADCSTDVLTVLVDTNPDERCEAFMGGLLACGQSFLERDTVKTVGYASLSGYMHTGGIVGMFHKSIHKDPMVFRIVDCAVSATEFYYEDNPDPRGYCYAVYGEIPSSDTRLVTGNTVVSFDKHKAPGFDKVLLPEKDEDPVYDQSVTSSTCTAFGYTTFTCNACGYSYTDIFTPPAHTPGPWTTIKAPSYTEDGSSGIFCTVDGILLQEEMNPRLTYQGSLDTIYKTTRSMGELLPEGAPTTDITWRSSDEGVATVDSDGNLKSVGRGSTTLTASTEDGFAFATYSVGVSYAWWQWVVRILLFGWIWY
jgi:hypothetical protein